MTALAPSRPVHLLPDRLGRWSVVRDGDREPLSRHGSATEAELAARATGREILVHDRYGRVRREPAAGRRG
jgi:hypothetical protein